MVRCQDAHPEFCAGVTWDALSWHLLAVPSLVLSILLCGVMPVLNYIWMRNIKSSFCKKMRRIVGTAESETVRHPALLNGCFMLEMLLSLWFAGQWVTRSYVHKVSSFARVLDQVLCLFFLVTYIINAMRNQFAVTYALQPTALITLFTVVPTFLQPEDESSSWFSFSYLRIANAVHAYEKLEKSGALRDVSEMKRGYAVTLLRTLVLVVILSGTTFSLEVLGDPELFVDKLVTTDMGEISFIQMVYWIFTTISTVGYGDFAPTTTLSRLFIIAAIIVGVCFFSTEVGNLLELHKLQSSGQGKWKPYKGNQHVIVIGGGVRGSSSVLKSMLEEIFRSSHGNSFLGWPNLSFMASAEQPTELRETIAALPRHGRVRTRYFMGDPTRHADMERLRMGEAALVIIITDLNAADIDQEDTSNILRALAVKQSYPHVNLRLMLQRPASKAKAVRAGIWPSRCFSISELKSALFALSCSVRGWSTMVTHFVVSENDEEDCEERTRFTGPVEDWILDFKQGRNFNITAFVVSSNYVGTEFLEFAREVAAVGCMPLGMQIAGNLQLNPIGHKLQEGEVVFAIAQNAGSLRNFEDTSANWRIEFLKNQRSAAMGGAASAAYRLGGARHAEADEQPKIHPAGTKHRMSLQVSSRDSTQRSGHFKIRMPGIMNWANLGHGHHPPHRGPMAAPATTAQHFEAPLGVPTAMALSLDTLRTNATVDRKIVELRELNDRAENIAMAGGHYIMVVLAGNPWQQMKALLRTLRGDHNPFCVPIIILVHHTPSTEVLNEMFTSTKRLGVMMTGPLATLNDLARAGMLRARCIMLYAGNAAEATMHDRRMIDGAGVTMLAAIEGALCEASQSNTYIVLELHRQESVKFMHRFPLYEEQYNADSGTWAHDPMESFTNHPRFASGGIFTASCLGALVARSFYTPGIVELLEAIVLLDDDDDNSYPWQVSLPPGFSGKTYGDIVQDFLHPKKGAICLGLYRRSFPGTGSSAGYVVTNPHPDTRLRPDDLVTVLAPKAFGEDCFEQGLVIGAVGAPRAEDPDDDCSPTSPASKVGSPTARSRNDTSPSAVLERREDGEASPANPAREATERLFGVQDVPQARSLQPPSAPPPPAGFQAGADEAGGIVPEAAFPSSLYEMQQELAATQRALRESQGREAALRAQLRACSLPLPAMLETPRARGGNSSLGAFSIQSNAQTQPPLPSKLAPRPPMPLSCWPKGCGTPERITTGSANPTAALGTGLRRDWSAGQSTGSRL
mmetsp:Transcript_11360/g.28623  ORF Transcript_11360/g.28623 Transcript_11360/m.28623 type:complete len:1253 (-) Transcript_11360:74-3832(-)